MNAPAVTRIRQLDTHRLIPSKYSEGADSALARIADDNEHLRGIFDLDHATNDRLLAENDLLPGIGTNELVLNIPRYRIINAAFTHAHPHGSRFSGPDRGAWYAAFELETSQIEVAWHKSVELAEVEWSEESIAYDDYLADFGGEYHDIRGDASFRKCLDPDSYVESQSLARPFSQNGRPGSYTPAYAAMAAPALRASDLPSSATFARALATALPGRNRSVRRSRSFTRDGPLAVLQLAS